MNASPAAGGVDRLDPEGRQLGHAVRLDHHRAVLAERDDRRLDAAIEKPGPASAGRLDVSLFNQSATHLVADVQGYLTDGAFVDLPDDRLLDTRTRE